MANAADEHEAPVQEAIAFGDGVADHDPSPGEDISLFGDDWDEHTDKQPDELAQERAHEETDEQPSMTMMTLPTKRTRTEWRLPGGCHHPTWGTWP